MFLKKYIKTILILFIFLPFKLFAQDNLINISGSIHSGYNLYDNYSFAPYFDKNTNEEFSSVARIIIEGNNYDKLSYEIHAVQAYNYSDVKTGIAGRGLSMLSADLGGDRINNADESANYYIDRANVKFSTEDVDVYLGRLAVSFGKPHFWNLFDYYGSSYLDQEYKAGIDALKIDKAFGSFSGITAVINEQNVLSSSGSYLENNAAQSYQWLGANKKIGLLLKGYTNYQDVDYALLYKREPEGHRLGLEIDGEMGTINLYNEITYLWGSEKISMPSSYQGNLIKNHFMNVLGASYHFDNNLDVTAEHLFNEMGDPDNLDASDIRRKNGVSTSLNNNLSAILMSYEFTPLLMSKYDAKLAWGDSSHQHNFSFIKSVTENIDLTIGGQLNFGNRPNGSNWQNPKLQSEYGSLSNIYYLELKRYF